jgi:hypothetical protein
VGILWLRDQYYNRNITRRKIVFQHKTIFYKEENSPLIFPVDRKKRPDYQTLYTLIFSYYDPVLRAQKLAAVLKQKKSIPTFK